MLERLLDILVCPACLPEENPLVSRTDLAEGGDILEGDLVCPSCGASYPIRRGTADLVPPSTRVPPVQARYDQERMAASYLWSHFADLWGDPQATDAYARWADMIHPSPGGPGLDAGCAVGRFTLEMAERCGFAVGIDLSRSFTTLARALVRRGAMSFEAPMEGRIRARFTIALPERLTANPVEFLTADAQAPPFRQSSFAVAASLNVVDKIPSPIEHLRQLQRVVAKPGRLLFSDPFSWSDEVADPQEWLGGTEKTGPGLANVSRILSREPGWRAAPGEPVWWTIRDHANRFERIRSQVVLAERDK